MDQQTISFSFTVEEANVVLGSLGAQPYQQVATLIDKIKQQASTQLQAASTPAPADTAE
jgi:hypothetical protein